MAQVSTNNFKNGLCLIVDNIPMRIVSMDIVKPGKGQAFTRVKLKNLQSGRVIERTYKSGESVEQAEVMNSDLEFLYEDGTDWHFMDQKSFEQFAANAEIMENAKKWIKPGDKCEVTTFDNNIISVEPPIFVELTVTETDPGVRGDTTSGGSKPATLETGAVIQVPLFINENDVLKVDTRDASYASRA